MKATTATIREILAALESQVRICRHSKNRTLMATTCMRIRQLRGILEVRRAA